MVGEVPAWLRYTNQGATRNQPLSPDLVDALAFLQDMGFTAEVCSGGQEGIGEGTRRTGSTRHDHGGAADVFFYQGDRKLDWSNPNDLPIFQDLVKRARAAGITGIGAGDGYMQPGSMHIGFGPESVWGAGGKGGNAPEWLRSAFGAAPAGTPPASVRPGGAAPLAFGGAAAMPAAGGASLAGMFGATGPADIPGVGFDLGSMLNTRSAQPKPGQDTERKKMEQDRRIALADLIRY